MPNRGNTERLYMDPTASATDAEVVDISSVDHVFTTPVRGIYVGVAGDITLVTLQGNSRLFSNVPLGVLPVGAISITKVGTAATNMLGLY